VDEIITVCAPYSAFARKSSQKLRRAMQNTKKGVVASAGNDGRAN